MVLGGNVDAKDLQDNMTDDNRGYATVEEFRTSLDTQTNVGSVGIEFASRKSSYPDSRHPGNGR